MPFIRKIKKSSGTYLALVESKRVNGKPRQKIIKYLGKEIEGKATRKVHTNNIKITSVKQHLDIEIIDHIATQLGLKQHLPPSTLILVYGQLLDRPSINKMEQWLNQTDILKTLEIENITTTQLYNALEQIQDLDFTKIEETIATHLPKEKEQDKNALVIDITDTYFEGEKRKEKPRRGKDGKVRKLLQIALAVTEKRGFPIFHRTFEGNISGKRIFTEMLALLVERGYGGMILDRGFWSDANIKEALGLDLRVICGVVKDKHFKMVLGGVDKAVVYRKENRVVLKNTKVYVVSMDYLGGKLLVVYNPYVDVVKREGLYDRGGLDCEGEFFGFSLIFHNTGLEAGEVVRVYFEKDVVERSFKVLKGVLSLRPVRVWLGSHVEAHVKVCYVAYAILSFLQFKVSKLGVSAVEALEVLRSGYRIELKDQDSGFEWEAMVELKKIQENIRNVVYKKG
jgi:transposase